MNDFLHDLTSFSNGFSLALLVPVSYVCHIYSRFPCLSDRLQTVNGALNRAMGATTSSCED